MFARSSGLRGDEVWRAAYEGRWSWSLAHRAAGAIEDGPGKIDPELFDNSHVFLIEYRDGLAGAVLMLGDNDHVKEHCYAGRRGQHIDALEYHVGAGPAYSVFGYLGLNIEDFFLTRRHPNPVERTYLTTGVLEAAMRSRGAGGSVIETPHLDIAYTISGEPRHRPVGSRPNDAGLKPWSAPDPGATPRAKPIHIGHVNPPVPGGSGRTDS